METGARADLPQANGARVGPPSIPRYLTLAEVAAILGCAAKTLHNSFGRGGGPYADLSRIKVSIRWLVPADEFETWLGRRRVRGRGNLGEHPSRVGASVGGSCRP